MPQADANPFRRASLKQSLTALELFKINAEHSPEHPLFVFELNSVTHKVSWKQFVAAIDHAAQLVIQSTPGLKRDEGKPTVIGMLAATDGITHYTFGYGILRAGNSAFLISTRNSPPAIAQLLIDTNCHDIFVSEDPAMQAACLAVMPILAERGHSLSIHNIPPYSTLYSENDLRLSLPVLATPSDWDTPAFILHSSGSTSFPKHVRVTHRILMQWIRHTGFADGDLGSDTIAIHGPMYHAMCFIMSNWAASTGMTIACFPPVSPPVQATSDSVLRSVIFTGSTIAYGVPSFVEQWAEDPEALTHLSRLKAVAFAGAPLTEAVGNLLAKKKIPMLHLYGATEIGCGTLFMPKTPQLDDWAYLMLAPHLNYMLDPTDNEGRHELVFLENENHRPCVFNSVFNGQPAYRTNDLLVRHPTNPGLWRIYGRKDDQLMLSTGEKTNPIPIEATLCRDPRIAFAVMFGRGRETNGVIVQPRTEYIFDPSDTEALANFRNHIWPTVAKANVVAPAHSRLFKEESMILVAPPEKPFELTPKGTPRRAFVIAAFEKEIELAYEAVRESSQSDVPPPSRWDACEILRSPEMSFETSCAHRSKTTLTFSGMDVTGALQATWIRNTILHTLRRSSHVPTKGISQNLVFDNPSVHALAHYITQLVTSPSDLPDTSSYRMEEKIKFMQGLVTGFSQNFPTHHASVTNQVGDVVLLTGTTGALGSHLLAHILVLPEVSRVYALNRRARNDVSLEQRQKTSFDDRGLDISLLASPKLSLLQTDTSLPLLGLRESLYKEIRGSVTHIIHNAWRLDFKISLPSFEPLVHGTRNLIDLALCSPHPLPPAFIFMSSVAVLQNWRSSELVPEAPVDAKIAVGSGYSESKWVTEMVLHAAAQSTSIRPTVVRIDQLSGAKNGSWNRTDSIPAIVRSGQVLGCLPDRKDNIVWLPVDVAAASIVDLCDSRVSYVHLRNPRPTPWHDVFSIFSAQLNIQLVPYAQWLSRLAEKQEEIESDALMSQGVPNNPAILLLDFYRFIGEDRGPVTAPMDISQALRVCQCLNNSELASALSEGEVKKWVKYWVRTGLLDG